MAGSKPLYQSLLSSTAPRHRVHGPYARTGPGPGPTLMECSRRRESVAGMCRRPCWPLPVCGGVAVVRAFPARMAGPRGPAGGLHPLAGAPCRRGPRCWSLLGAASLAAVLATGGPPGRAAVAGCSRRTVPDRPLVLRQDRPLPGAAPRQPRRAELNVMTDQRTVRARRTPPSVVRLVRGQRQSPCLPIQERHAGPARIAWPLKGWTALLSAPAQPSPDGDGRHRQRPVLARFPLEPVDVCPDFAVPPSRRCRLTAGS